ncbi:MAG TPA: ATP phosphoribosyltransferase [Gemmatimonadaceae bacterium]|nr:ATP phosphoribosyltransferase [Gemmatimonadaceae bacterium]
MLRIALPNKGRLSDDTRDLFRDAGLDFRSAGERALVATLGESFEAIFVRSQDIPEFVADGAADAGVTGSDLVAESGREVAELLDLEFGRCRVVVAAREDRGIQSMADIPPNARVATVFPRLTEQFFALRAHAVTVVPVSGATEIAPHLGIADVVVDITSTGSTLRVNGLREIETVFESSARLIARAPTSASDEREASLNELATGLASVLRARGSRYLMANVPRSALDAVKAILPGISGPTVVDIKNGGSMVAVHAVVPAKTIYRTIASLKAVGAEGILVTRIERLTP